MTNVLWYRLTSVALLGVALYAGWTVWPRTETANALRLAIAENREVVLATSSPAFILDDSLHAHQCGRLHARDGLTLVPYDLPDCLERARGGVLVAYTADLRMLWSLLTEQERDEITQSLKTTSHWLRGTLTLSRTQPFFLRDYIPQMREILRDALISTMERRPVREAFERAMASLDRKAVDRLLTGIGPVAQEHFEAELWSNLGAVAGGLIGGPRSTSALTDLMLRVFNDPRVRERLGTTIAEIGSSPAMADAAMVTAVEFSSVLLEDARVPQFIQQLLTDRRLAEMASLSRGTLGEGLPRKILKLRSKADHNPLSAYVVSLAVHWRSGNIVLMLTPEQYQRLRPLAGSGIILDRVSGQGTMLRP